MEQFQVRHESFEGFFFSAPLEGDLLSKMMYLRPILLPLPLLLLLSFLLSAKPVLETSSPAIYAVREPFQQDTQ